jgi:3-oxoacyl-[acyl-carrier protein] reductase
MSNQKLAGKVAAVTGASKGIGASIAEHLAAAGASVVINYASSKAGADQVVEKITKAGGTVINISSVAGVHPLAMASVYSATKGAVDAVSKTLAKELGPKKIRVNSLNPGMVETEGVHSAGFLGTDFHKWVIEQTPLGRIGQPDDIGKVAVFLASDDSGWITGQTLLVSGGQY